MTIQFDMYGNIIPQKVSYKPKLNDLTKDMIKEASLIKVDKYWCSECNRFHKKMYRGKQNFTFIKHHIHSIEVSESYIWSKKLRNSCEHYDIRQHVKTIGSRKQ